MSGFLAAVFIHAYEFVLHVYVLADWYAQTAELWRDATAMQDGLHWTITRHVITGLFLALLFGFSPAPHTMRAGMRFGLVVGVLFTLPGLTSFVYLNVPAALSLAWSAAYVLEGVGIGAVLGLCYSPKAPTLNDESD
ncbi:MAG: hypothetical protein CMM94_05190 [Rickettsiales bacterium]|nr:hypothetical protein [Rickettsiales bacterium]